MHTGPFSEDASNYLIIFLMVTFVQLQGDSRGLDLWVSLCFLFSSMPGGCGSVGRSVTSNLPDLAARRMDWCTVPGTEVPLGCLQ